MALFVFGDECGHSNLDGPDPNWPIFVFAATVCKSGRYKNEIVPAFKQLKRKHFEGKEPVFRSYMIRKAEGDFSRLKEPGRWKPFEQDLRKAISDAPFVLIASAIRVNDHIAQYTNPEDPYKLSMEFILEKTLMAVRESGDKEVRFIMESRNAKHDNELRQRFNHILKNGTRFKSPDRFRNANYTIDFVPKRNNIIGTQISDLMAYPIAQNIITPGYRAYTTAEEKLYTGPKWMKHFEVERPPGWKYGLKIFP